MAATIFFCQYLLDLIDFVASKIQIYLVMFIFGVRSKNIDCKFLALSLSKNN